jgi:hypothetical protein
MQDADASASARVRAAKTILEAAVKAVEYGRARHPDSDSRSRSSGDPQMTLARFQTRLVKVEAQWRPAVVAAVLWRMRQCAPANLDGS